MFNYSFRNTIVPIAFKGKDDESISPRSSGGAARIEGHLGPRRSAGTYPQTEESLKKMEEEQEINLGEFLYDRALVNGVLTQIEENRAQLINQDKRLKAIELKLNMTSSEGAESQTEGPFISRFFRMAELLEGEIPKKLLYLHGERHGATDNFKHDIKELQRRMNNNPNRFINNEEQGGCIELLNKKITDLENAKKEEKHGEKRKLKYELSGAAFYLLDRLKPFIEEDKKIDYETLENAMKKYSESMKNYDNKLDVICKIIYTGGSIAGGAAVTATGVGAPAGSFVTGGGIVLFNRIDFIGKLLKKIW